VAVVVVGALVIWQFYMRSPTVEPASVDKMAFPLPEKPSIAVLPFDNMSGDQTQEYIADGITESITTALSKVPNLFVIARNSSFTYKGKPVKIQQVSEDLGVRYVLEGSVQKSGDNIRINAQLIDAIKGHHIWAEKYDRKFKDIFALQDDITLNILKELHVELTGLGAEYAKGTDNPEAYLKFIKGIYHYYRFNKEDNTIARELGEEAIALDPNYAAAFRLIGSTYHAEIWGFYSENYKESIAKVEEWAQKTLALDDSNAGGHALMATAYKMKGKLDKAIAEGKKATALDPNSADILVGRVDALKIVDRPEEALRLMEKAMRLNPKPHSIYYWSLGSVLHMLGRYDEAIAAYEPIFSHKLKYMSYIGHVGLTFAYLELGQEAEARNHAAEALKIRPDSLVAWASALFHYKDMTYLKRLAKPLDSLQYADAGKRKVYVNEETPFFKFEYPAGSVKVDDPNPIFFPVLTMRTPGGNEFVASVLDVTEDMALADIGPKYYVERLKNHGLGSNVKLISNDPFVLKDGTNAYRTDFEYLLATGTMKMGVVIVSAFKDKKLVVLDIHTTAGEQSYEAWIPESLTFE
jgi:adenylate cyclase